MAGRTRGFARVTTVAIVATLLTTLTAGPLQAQRVPEICAQKRSCFMVFDGPERGFCQAYIEGRSCFMSFNDKVDRGWCQYLLEGRSCFMSLDGAERTKCEAGKIPKEHRHWLRLCKKKSQ